MYGSPRPQKRRTTKSIKQNMFCLGSKHIANERERTIEIRSFACMRAYMRCIVLSRVAFALGELVSRANTIKMNVVTVACVYTALFSPAFNARSNTQHLNGSICIYSGKFGFSTHRAAIVWLLLNLRIDRTSMGMCCVYSPACYYVHILNGSNYKYLKRVVPTTSCIR